MIKKSLSLVLTIILLCAQNSWADFVGNVVGIHDGDTIQVKVPEMVKPIKVRLWGVDSLEIDFMGKSQGQPAFEARDFLRYILPLNSVVKVITGDTITDKNNRTLGIIEYQGRNINYQMLENGFAFLYVIAPYEKKKLMDLVEACHLAASRKIGVFSKNSEEYLEPYFFRLKVQRYQGANVMGDLANLKIIDYQNQTSVHPCNRVFFPTIEMAKAKGFTF